MRIKNSFIVTVAALLVTAGLSSGIATAQEAGTAVNGSIVVGAIGSDITGDKARYQRFRDLGEGGAGGPFRVSFDNEAWSLKLGADSIGRRDQNYFGKFEQRGKLKVEFEWDEIPTFYSDTTRTLFTETSPGVLRVDDDVQRDIAAGVFGIADAVQFTRVFDARSSSRTASLDATYRLSTAVDVNMTVDSRRRSGIQQFSASFGFGNVLEVPMPLDDSTTNVALGVEYASTSGLLRLEYRGSFFENDIDALIWDNPLTLTDAPNRSSQGRKAVLPSNSSHQISTTGSVKLPGRSRMTGMLAFGFLDQNDALVPHTINSSLAAVPLDRGTAEASADTVAANLSFTSRPTRDVRISARYRYFDYENKTLVFDGSTYVRTDDSVRTEGGHSEPFSRTRKNLDVDVGYSPTSSTLVKVGYAHAAVDRTFRIFENTTENTFRFSFDATGSQYVTVRAKYEASNRNGNGLVPELLVAVGEQPGMRHFDIADRNRKRFTTIVTLNPSAAVGVNLSAAIGEDDFPDSQFGLRDNKHYVFSIGFDAAPSDNASLGASYTYENYSTLQNSRNTSPGATFVDPNRNWSVDTDDTVHTLDANVELLQVLPKWDLRFSYVYSKSTADYLFAVSSALADPAQLPPVKNTQNRVTVDSTYALSEQLSLGAVYWFDKYSVQDYSLDGTIGLTPPPALLLGNFFLPYEIHTAFVRLIYTW